MREHGCECYKEDDADGRALLAEKGAKGSCMHGKITTEQEDKEIVKRPIVQAIHEKGL